MKNYLKHAIALLFIINVLTACTDDNDEIIPDVKEETTESTIEPAKILYNFNFEDGSENFVSGIYCDYPVNKKVLNTSEEDNHCGIAFRGKKEDFKDWFGFSYTGNETYFIATDYENCGGIFMSSVEAEITFTSDFTSEDLNLNLNYYLTKDHSKWGAYMISISIYDENYDYNSSPIATINPPLNPKGWTNYTAKINAPLPKGTYKFVISQMGGQSAFDDVIIYKN